MRWILIGAIGLLAAGPGAQDDAAPVERVRVLTKELVDNVRVQLVAARTSERRGQNLEVRLAPVHASRDVVEPADEVRAVFAAHGHTTHETSLIAVLTSGVDAAAEADPHAWRAARQEVVLSLPADPARALDFERWWIVSVRCPAAAPSEDGR